QACLLPRPDPPQDLFEQLILRYLDDLKADGRSDRMGGVRTLAEEFADPQSGPSRHLASRFDGLIFDGFHRLDLAELDLIAALSQRCTVVLWLLGVPGQLSWRTAQAAYQFLEAKASVARVIDYEPDDPQPLVRVGRCLFPAEPGDRRDPVAIPGIYRHE